MTSLQSSELTELPVVENSQLFAQRTVRPLWPVPPPGLELVTHDQASCSVTTEPRDVVAMDAGVGTKA